jgi:hypothetical protein
VLAWLLVRLSQQFHLQTFVAQPDDPSYIWRLHSYCAIHLPPILPLCNTSAL